MRRKDKLVTDLKMLHEVIQKTEVCRLGLVDGLKPYVIPLCYGFDGTHLYFHSAVEGRKVEILKCNNHVCAEFEKTASIIMGQGKPCKWGVHYFTVLCNGTAEVITDPDVKSYGLNQIIKHYKPEAADYPFTERELSSVLVFKITVEDIAGKISGSTF